MIDFLICSFLHSPSPHSLSLSARVAELGACVWRRRSSAAGVRVVAEEQGRRSPGPGREGGGGRQRGAAEAGVLIVCFGPPSLSVRAREGRAVASIAG